MSKARVVDHGSKTLDEINKSRHLAAIFVSAVKKPKPVQCYPKGQKVIPYYFKKSDAGSCR